MEGHVFADEVPTYMRTVITQVYGAKGPVKVLAWPAPAPAAWTRA